VDRYSGAKLSSRHTASGRWCASPLPLRSESALGFPNLTPAPPRRVAERGQGVRSSDSRAAGVRFFFLVGGERTWDRKPETTSAAHPSQPQIGSSDRVIAPDGAQLGVLTVGGAWPRRRSEASTWSRWRRWRDPRSRRSWTTASSSSRSEGGPGGEEKATRHPSEEVNTGRDRRS